MTSDDKKSNKQQKDNAEIQRRVKYDDNGKADAWKTELFEQIGIVYKDRLRFSTDF